MNKAVADNWLAFNAPLEGRMNCMYVDIKGLVTCAIGILIDPIEYALRPPWRHPITSTYAIPDEIRAEWNRVKAAPFGRSAGVKYWESTAQLILSEEDIDEWVMDEVRRRDKALNFRFPWYGAAPADVQMATLSMAWAMGEGFSFPKWEAAAASGDWETCSFECRMLTVGNPGIIPRNAANQTLFEAAAILNEPDVLHWKPK